MRQDRILLPGRPGPVRPLSMNILYKCLFSKILKLAKFSDILTMTEKQARQGRQRARPVAAAMSHLKQETHLRYLKPPPTKMAPAPVNDRALSGE